MVSSPSDIDDRVLESLVMCEGIAPRRTRRSARQRRSSPGAAFMHDGKHKGAASSGVSTALSRAVAHQENTTKARAKETRSPLPDSKPSTPPYHSARL
jgi:hypothetical protein